jgi:DNA-binding transcriptional ArsR family regulator
MVEYSPDALDDTFQALANPIRREIVSQLVENRKTVLELASQFDISLNGVSKHIKVLENAGLIRREIKGRTHYCQLNPVPLQQANEWIEHYRTFWNQRLDALDAYLEKHR